MARGAPRRGHRARSAALLLALALALAGPRRCFVPPAGRPAPGAAHRGAAWAAAVLPPASGASAAGSAPMGVAPSPASTPCPRESRRPFSWPFSLAWPPCRRCWRGRCWGPCGRHCPRAGTRIGRRRGASSRTVYMAAGVAHFTAAEPFEAIYPPTGTWGLWYLPGSAQFHVAWTGVAELLGGAGLFLGSLALGIAGALGQEPPRPLRALPAAAALGLYVLTWCVTPANVYMYTHGAIMTGLTPGDAAIPVEIHAVRGAFQVVLLGLLWNFYESSWPSEDQPAEA
ncbi:unnamed protein product [Prorocentrum cordatum]|uniref:Uncharacterized protein n=1 Tax=Prorocentrum cordatum TaxID=2364126 RepID=A0ABN9V995_9DINO|nr:unnamed protein product [Polarella glacialis]